jgi:hypothetical protein
LQNGRIIILRRVPEILVLREQILKLANELGGKEKAE